MVVLVLRALQRDVADLLRRVGVGHFRAPGLPDQPSPFLGEHFGYRAHLAQRGQPDASDQACARKLDCVRCVAEQVGRIVAPQPVELPGDDGAGIERRERTRGDQILRGRTPGGGDPFLQMGTDDGKLCSQVPAMPQVVAQRKRGPVQPRQLRLERAHRSAHRARRERLAAVAVRDGRMGALDVRVALLQIAAREQRQVREALKRQRARGIVASGPMLAVVRRSFARMPQQRLDLTQLQLAQALRCQPLRALELQKQRQRHRAIRHRERRPRHARDRAADVPEKWRLPSGHVTVS